MNTDDHETGKVTYPSVSVIVPVYNRINLTLAFLRSFRSVTYPNYRMIIVDDGSTDGTPEAVEQQFPSTMVIRTQGDQWWSKCMNTGLVIALDGKTDYVLTLNDDVVVDPAFLTNLVAYAVQHPRTLVGSFIFEFSRPEKLWYAGGKVVWLRGELLHRSSLTDGTLAWLTGMGTLIPVDAFHEAGLYDDVHLPQYAADAEFSLRARERGFALGVIAESVIWNKAEESSQKLIRRHVTLQTLFLPLRSMKSDALMSMRLYLYRRHWPLLLRPFAFSFYYLKFMAKQTKRLFFAS